jgi:protein-S-isoprenylcysteine O-methyltransferase Ste14
MITASSNDGARVRIPPPMVFLSGALASWLAHQAVPMPLGVAGSFGSGLALAAFVFGAGFLLASANLVRRTGQDPLPWKPTPSVIDTGIYAWTRNPMYVGMAAIELALGLWMNTAWILGAVPLAMFIVYRTAIQPEEAYLLEKFGQEYASYKARVRRWL